ncbi:MAG: DMT family transporter [Actinomycetota bacterium]|nr:DMT family transporter [Euzebyaceae bacterium]MDQ3451294.1 DMT family transporter [Actinomycetota bacterium]
MTGVALVVVSAAAFGALAIFAKTAYASGADPIAVLAARFVIAAVCMVGLLVLRRERLPRGRVLLALMALGGIGYVGQSFTFFTAAQLIPASLASLLLYVYPAIVAVLAATFLRQRITGVRLLALLAALAGSALTVGQASGGTPLGIAMALASAMFYSCYIIVGSRVTPHAGAVASTTVIISTAALVYTVLTVVQRPPFPGDAGGWAAVAALALVSTVLAIGTFFAGLQRVGPADASTISALEPLVTVVLAAMVLGETVTPGQMVGGALILSAVVVLSRVSGRRMVPQEAPPT